MNFSSFKNIFTAPARLALLVMCCLIGAAQTYAQKAGDDKVYTATEKSAEFPGGFNIFSKYLAKNIHYPALAVQKNVKGKVFVTFVVEKNGTLSHVKVVRGIGAGCDAEAVRVLKSSPKWQPAIQKGKAVRSQFTAPINFALASNDKVGTIKSKTTDDKMVFHEVENQASFPGGEKQFFSYLGKVIHYPVAAREKNIQGKVVLAFIVEKDGSLSNISVKNSVGAGCDEEAIRALKNGPKWVPAKQNGHVVRAEYVLPVSFALTKV